MWSSLFTDLLTLTLSLAGFASFDLNDQYTIVRLGQSQSRILVAATNWYNADKQDFKDFLSWRARTYEFKQALLNYCHKIHMLRMDRVEAALLNVLVLIATGEWKYHPVMACAHYAASWHQLLGAAGASIGKTSSCLVSWAENCRDWVATSCHESSYMHFRVHDRLGLANLPENPPANKCM